MTLTIDETFAKVGEFRKFQWFYIVIFGYVYLALNIFPAMIVSFITAEPDWECVDGYMNNTVCRFNTSISLTSDDYKARCKMPRESWKYVDSFTSVVTEYDLVCDDSILLSIAQSCYWVGMLVGLLAGGYLGDKYGRKFIFYSGCAGVVLATWIMIFPKAFVVFIVCRIAIGFGSGFRKSTTYALLVEFTTAKYRSDMMFGSFVIGTAGLMALPLIGYFVRLWRIFLLITAICALPCLLYWWLLSESPRWLLLHGKEDVAVVVFRRVARINKRSLPDNMGLQKSEISKTRSSFRQLFSGWKTSITTLICWDIWFATALVYYGLSYGSVDLGGNRYLNFFLVNVGELPSSIALFWSVKIFGRKKTVICGLIFAFVASAASVAITTNESPGHARGRVAAAIAAKFFINLSYTGTYLWSAELFPTVIRSTAMATSSSAARIGSFSASYIIWLIRIHPGLPYGIMGVICLQAAVLALFLPETSGAPTLETMADMKKRKEQGIDNLAVNPGDKSGGNGNETLEISKRVP